MDKRLEPLFTPWKIGSCEIKNRIVLTSMGGTDLFGWMEKNHFDKMGARFILKIAQNNVGLVLPGCQPVYNPMFGQWLHKDKKMFEDLKAWMPEFHKTGAKLFIQLTAGFGRSFTISTMMEKLYANPALRAASRPFMDLDKITASASPAPNRWSDKVPSREMTVEEIHEFIYAFAESAKLLRDAGVDGVEIHAVHEGYLLDQFALPYVNKRTDEYGGSLENRYRFAAEIVKAIKAVCGKDFPVSLRYSVVSKTKGFRQGPCLGRSIPRWAGTWPSRNRRRSSSRMRAMICLTATTGPTTPGIGPIRPSICLKTATWPMWSTSSSLWISRWCVPGGWTPRGGGLHRSGKAGRRGLRPAVSGRPAMDHQAHAGKGGRHPPLHSLPQRVLQYVPLRGCTQRSGPERQPQSGPVRR